MSCPYIALLFTGIPKIIIIINLMIYTTSISNELRVDPISPHPAIAPWFFVPVAGVRDQRAAAVADVGVVPQRGLRGLQLLQREANHLDGRLGARGAGVRWDG